MFAKLESLERKFLDLEQELADPTVFNDQDRYRKLTKAHSDLKPVVDIFRQYRELKQNLADNQELLNDADPDGTSWACRRSRRRGRWRSTRG